MNARQLVQQIKSILDALAWPDGDQERVFGHECVRIASGLTDLDGMDLPSLCPLALIGVGSSTHDEDDPDIVEQTVRLVLMAQHGGDRYGTKGMIGGNLSGGIGSSNGRGVLEIEEVALPSVMRLTGIDGCHMQVSATTSADLERVGGRSHLVARAYDLRCLCTVAPTNPAARVVAASETGGTVTLTWQSPTNRFDWISSTIRRTSGTSPAASVASGTSVASGVTNETTTDAPGSGTFTYTVFEGYEDVPSLGIQTYSNVERGSYVTIEVA